MNIIIAGTREMTDFDLDDYLILDSDDMCIPVADKSQLTVLSGGASGVDKLGEQWAWRNDVPCKVYEAEWDIHGNAAGPIRNTEMAKDGDVLVAIWNGVSPGTRDMIDTALDHGLDIHVKNIDIQSEMGEFL